MASRIGSFTVVKPFGDDAEARVFAEKELERLAKQLDEEPVSPPAQASVYTAYLFPFGVPGRARGNEDTPVQIHFPYADPQMLAATMRREVEHLYATGGEERSKHLGMGISLSSYQRIRQAGGELAFRYRNVVPFASPDEDQAACETVLAAWETANREVLAEAAAELPKIQERALELAEAQLGTAREQIRDEAEKYLYLGRAGATPEEILDPSLDRKKVHLGGPKLGALVVALRQVHALRAALDRAVERQEEARRAERPLGPAATAVAGAAMDLALLWSVRALDYPVLHRISGISAIPASVEMLQDWNKVFLKSRDQAGASTVERLRDQLVTSLRTAWSANAGFAASLRDNREHVWRYPPLIGRTLDDMGITDPSIAYRAAQDRLKDENGLTLVDALSIGHAALALGATVAAPAPPAGVALAIVGAILTLADLTLDYLKRKEQDEAFNAVLNPDLAVASEPGYWGLLVGVAFAVFDIKGVQEAFVALRVAGEARSASELVDLVTP